MSFTGVCLAGRSADLISNGLPFADDGGRWLQRKAGGQYIGYMNIGLCSNSRVSVVRWLLMITSPCLMRGDGAVGCLLWQAG